MSTPIPLEDARTFVMTRRGRQLALDADGLGLKLELTHIALGSGQRALSDTATALLQERQRAAIAEGFLTPDGLQLQLAAEFGPSAQYNVYEVGVFAGDDLVFLWSTAAPGDYLMVKNAAVRAPIGFALLVPGVPTEPLTIADSGGSIGVLWLPYRTALVSLFNAHAQQLLREIRRAVGPVPTPPEPPPLVQPPSPESP